MIDSMDLRIPDVAGPEWSDLSDIQSIFEASGTDRLPSTGLASALAEIETSPWGEWSHGKAITAPKLARLLGKFGITPGTVRFPDGKTAKGYYGKDFTDAWGRYVRQNTTPLSPPVLDPSARRNNATPLMNTSESSDLENVTHPSCDASENEQNPNKNVLCDVVTVSDPSARTRGVEEDL
jgi:hypothetical protein